MFGLRLKRQKSFTDIDAPALAQMIDGPDAPVLVDVRSPEEFARGHIEGSRLLPLSVLPVRYHELPKDATLVVICRSGARSRLACETLAGYGFENLINLNNGVLGWSARGYKMVQ